jgi:hypothetical protein
MATLDADLAVALVLSITTTVVVSFVVLLIAMLMVIRRDPVSHVDERLALPIARTSYFVRSTLRQTSPMTMRDGYRYRGVP